MVVLHHLHHDAVNGRIIGLDNVRRNRRQSGLPRSKGSTLTGPHNHGAVFVTAGEDRRQYPVLLDTGDEFTRQVHLRAHVRLDHDQVRVNVHYGAHPGGAGSHWVLSPSTSFFACLARESIESGSAAVRGLLAEIREPATAPDKRGTQARERTTMTGQTDKKMK